MSTEEVLNETMDVVEKTLDIMEGAEQAGDCASLLARRTKVSVAVGLAVGAAAGGGIAWYISRRHYKLKYEALAEQEIAEAKAFYNRLAKTELTSSDEPVERDEKQLSESGAKAAAALISYKGDGAAVGEIVVEEEEIEVEVEPVRPARSVSTNVFEQNRSEMIWDQDVEEAYRETIGEGEPYIICQMEFNENENEYDQKTLTYFAEDQVLVDEQDKPIDMVDMVVGEENLVHFGHGHTDNRVVLIRNDKLSMDFEVVKNDGSYAKEVLGFQHSSEPSVKMRHPNRRPTRDVDE